MGYKVLYKGSKLKQAGPTGKDREINILKDLMLF